MVSCTETRSKKKKRKWTHRFWMVDALGRQSYQDVPVRAATSKVVISLSAVDIKRALAADPLPGLTTGGVANVDECAGAQCVLRSANVFPHPVFRVHWQYARAYIVTALYKDGRFKSAVVYRHRDKMAKAFDTWSGMKKLQARLEKHGPMTIELSPPSSGSRDYEPRGTKGPKNTENAKSYGSRLRFGVALNDSGL